MGYAGTRESRVTQEQDSMPEPQRQRLATVPRHAGDIAARNSGLLLIATVVVTLLMVAARVMVDADQPTLLESLEAIAESRISYGLSGAARLVSGVTLLAGAWFLLTTWTIRQRRSAPMLPWLIVLRYLYSPIGAVRRGLGNNCNERRGSRSLQGAYRLFALDHRKGGVHRRWTSLAGGRPVPGDGGRSTEVHIPLVRHHRSRHAPDMD